jgi:glutaminase
VEGDSAFVSTGELPPPELARKLVAEAHERYRSTADGAVSEVYPALARVPPDLFGICVVATHGAIFSVGDAEVEFAIMSVAKPFVFALVCETLGPEDARRLLGVNSTGLAFNSLSAIERSADGRTNPMVNPGAIAATSLVPGADAEAKWEVVRDGLSRFAGRELSLDDDTYRSASETNARNQSIARLLQSYGRIQGDPAVATDLYTRQSCLNVTARDLAVMGATLADGGVNPVTGERVVDAITCRYTLAVMATAGLYENSGDWLYDVGLPGKSGIGGGIITVAPGKGGLGTFSPRLDEAGNSVRGQLAARFVSRRLGLDIFLSSPAA